jgi:TRAP-type C4-dicarboxylate transport system permease small subunit
LIKKGKITSLVFYLEGLPRILNMLGFVVLLGLVFWGVIGVTAQYFKHPIVGIIEFTEVAVPFAILLPLIHVQQTRGHITVNIISRHFSPRVSQILEIAWLIVQVLLLALFAWRLSLRAWASMLELEVFSSIFTPVLPYKFPGRMAAAAAFLGAAIVVVWQILSKCARRQADARTKRGVT